MAYSLARRSSSLQGSASWSSKGMGAGAAAVAMNSPCCPDSRIREARCNVARASSTEASSGSRGPRESSAPDLIRLSKTRLFKARFDAFAEIIKRLELALRQARFANGLGGVFANVLDSGKAKTNGFAHRR